MNDQKTIQQNFLVPFHYDVIFSRSIFNLDNLSLINSIKQEHHYQRRKIVFIIDKGVADSNIELIDAITDYFNHYHIGISTEQFLVVEGGEAIKNNQDNHEKILQFIHDNKVDRHSFVAAIGGGAVLDAVGYMAAIAHRGIRLIRIPTTVLSQNDSGIGVKNGINYFGKKNFLGTFAPPYAVINDSDFLKTLDVRNWRSGISEAIKVALIKDENFFCWIEDHALALNNGKIDIMEELIFRCAELHAHHISKNGDPFENGSSRPLDFGHWVAHKLEHITNYELLHGEAVAIGIALDSAYSYLSNKIDLDSLNRILDCLLALGFTITHPFLITHFDEILSGIDEFREHLGGELTITLLSKIGKGEEVHTLLSTTIANSIQYLSFYSQSVHVLC
ncbi:3-dehydroquinate synthase [Chryseobacterium sp. ES2]|jgi:3-dehydroquinate synthase|uniref:3-dehydroquinate synthase n=1 Tax=Chryseobacterium metallicongregator TaxID=3073042 RepID=A0ABU1DZM9_9FLAO|nr:3-dehydroquinate synthase [Chryseobacterium sp. ES2]MDR4950994.1 3-dehydroquinate synthase [Chryseobacterium sp. ES2]